ncbi:MAG TPA: MFS transporter [Acidimicrobiales bacterium]|nr:MFS transporter [Acidimicrobiales bacterium]
MTTDGGWRELRPPPRPAAVRASPFARLTLTQALSVAGDTLVTMALAGSLFFSISPNAARGRVTLSLVLTMAPFAVVAPFLGPVIDRSRGGRRVMVVGSCIGRAIAAYVMARVLHQLLLFPAAFTTLVLSKGYFVARTALVPAAVQSDDELVEANAKLSIVGVLAGLAAAVPGVVALRLLDARWALYLAVAVFVVAGVAGARLEDARDAGPAGGEPRGRSRDAAPHPADATTDRARPAGQAKTSVVNDLGISTAAVAMALLRAIVGFLTFLVAFGFRHLGAPSWWFGIVLATSYGGALASSLIAPPLRRAVREETLIGAGLVAVTVSCAVIGRLHGPLWAAAVAAVVGTASGVAKLAFDALVQRDAPAHLHGRSFARFEAGFQIAWVAGALLPVVVATPLSRGYDVMAVATFLAAVAYVVARRALRRSEVRPTLA